VKLPRLRHEAVQGADDLAALGGPPREGLVLVPLRLDRWGEPAAFAWVEPEAAADWDARGWRSWKGH